MYFILGFVLFFVIVIGFVMNLPVFGKNPRGGRLAKIKALPNYKDGELKNQSFTPVKPEDVTYWQMFAKMIKGNENGSPTHAIPTSVPDFSTTDTFKLTWFGHSSYLIQVDGTNILVDPVFSERPSPFQFIGTKRFDGTGFLTVEDLPNLDVVLITHDHYDHLDYTAVLKLKKKTKVFVASLGVGGHLERWGIKNEQLVELSWGEKAIFSATISFTAAPARHFSGRGFKRNQTLWSSFILKTKDQTIYIGGDSGTDHHFKTIGETYGPFDLAILECGQYNTMWPMIHMFPEQTVAASIALNAKKLLPVHWGKYKLALHDWNEPITRLVKKAEELNVSVITPMLGETFTLTEATATKHWWLNL